MSRVTGTPAMIDTDCSATSAVFALSPPDAIKTMAVAPSVMDH